MKTKAKPKSNGVILWRGPSQLDGHEIVVIAIGLRRKSANGKTGALLQTYILRTDLSPKDAVATGADFSICGNCKLRPVAFVAMGRVWRRLRRCYVNLGQGPLNVFKALQRGVYPQLPENDLPAVVEVGRGRDVRIGTYGDPAAVPLWVWAALIQAAADHTAYTHQHAMAPQLRGICMASADTVEEAQAAQAAGWRYFRVVQPGDPLKLPGEAKCPASAESGRKLQCQDCMACSGAGSGRRGSIVIQAHGGFATMHAVRQLARVRP